MTEFKKGDRVKVEFEGEVTQADRLGVHVKTSGGFSFVPGSTAVTLLERPVEPLAPGSVVRSSDGDTWVVKRNGITYVPAAGEPFGSIETPESLARLVRDQSGFTLIHDGGSK